MTKTPAAAVGIAVLMLVLVNHDGSAQAQESDCFGLNPTITGTDGDDTITRTDGGDVIAGLGGNDTIDGLTGDDRICGGDGADQITDEDGTWLAGDAGADTITAGSPSAEDHISSYISGGVGNDVIRTEAGVDYAEIQPGPGTDTIEALGTSDLLDYRASDSAVRVDLSAGTATGEGPDTLTGIELVYGSHENDHLSGSSAPEWFNGQGGADTVRGRDGTDTIVIGLGDDSVDGGPGTDGVRVERYGLTVNLDRGVATSTRGHNISLASIDNVFGGDRLIGDDGPNLLVGGQGRQFIDGKRGDDLIKPGGAGDKVFAGKGDDTVAGCSGGRDRILMGPGRDVVDVVGEESCGHSPGDDHLIDGGEGWDEVSYKQWWADVPLRVDMRAGTACLGPCDHDGPTELSGVEVVRATDFDDRLLGNDLSNALFGGVGNDLLDGRGGRDRLDGGEGQDDCRNGETVSRCE